MQRGEVSSSGHPRSWALDGVGASRWLSTVRPAVLPNRCQQRGLLSRQTCPPTSRWLRGLRTAEFQGSQPRAHAASGV